MKFTSNWRFIFPRLVICVKYGSFIRILYQFHRLPVLCVKYGSFIRILYQFHRLPVLCVKYGSFTRILYQFHRLPVLCVKYDSFYSYINFLDFLFLIVTFHFSVSETLFDYNRDNYFEISAVFVLTLVFINFKKSLRPIVLDNLFG